MLKRITIILADFALNLSLCRMIETTTLSGSTEFTSMGQLHALSRLKHSWTAQLLSQSLKLQALPTISACIAHKIIVHQLVIHLLLGLLGAANGVSLLSILGKFSPGIFQIQPNQLQPIEELVTCPLQVRKLRVSPQVPSLFNSVK